MLLEIPCAIFLAKILNRLSIKVNQPGVLGEIGAGILLGPCCFGSLSYMSKDISLSSFNTLPLDLNSPTFKTFAFLGAIFLMFIVGLETNTKELHTSWKPGFFAGILSVIISFCMGCLIGIIFHFTLMQSIIIGVIFLTTSAIIAIRIFTDLRILSTPLGNTMKTAVIVSELLAMFIVFSVFLNGGSSSQLILIIILFTIIVGIGFLLISILSHTTSFKKKVIDFIIPCVLIGCLPVSACAHNPSVTSIIGAFVIGFIFRKTFQVEKLLRYAKQIGYTFFIPLFFVSVGASFDFSFLLRAYTLAPLILFISVFLLVGLSGNFIGGYVGSRVSGLNRNESLSIGIGMIPICGTTLVFVTTAVDKGYFGDQNSILVNQIKIATIMLIIVSSFLTPLLLKKSINRSLSDRGKHVSRWSFIKSFYEDAMNRSRANKKHYHTTHQSSS